MSAVVFAGPSLPPSVAPVIAGVEWHPPVRQGDLYEAALRRPAIIGVIDGYFERVPTVWHKEILWAMAHGIHVYGASSIGALRAAELETFGMQGVGRIFRRFADGELIDDEEVAVMHGPAELDYVQVSEAMVNVRATLDRATALSIVTPAVAAELVGIAKSLFYKNRTYEAVLDAAADSGVSPEMLARLAGWLPAGKVDQKRLDALAMVKALAEQLERGVVPLKVSYELAHTFAWEEVRLRADAASEV